GEIVQMSPQDPLHARSTSRLTRWFIRALGEEYVVRPQLPITLPDSEPEPDLAVVWTRDEDSLEDHPRTALLVIEVADSSARYDLVVKSRIYAKAGIPEYWLVLVRKHVIEVLRDPDPATGVYLSRLTMGEGDSVAPKALPGPTIDVRALFA
ncbi:MAG TPA: Uma2 family endonuclease, partial [Vicinamibacteria bacterium]